MKRSRRRRKGRSEGFSLIEMVVTLLVSGVVFVTATLIMGVGLRQYQSVDAETVIQEESQAAQFYLTEFFQEADDYHVVSIEGMECAVEVRKGADWYALARIGDELRVCKCSASAIDTAARFAELVSLGRSKTFLARGVTDFSVVPESRYEDGKDKGFVHLSYEFGYGNKTYVSRSYVKFRSGQVN